jgi:hypothetical protein
LTKLLHQLSKPTQSFTHQQQHSTILQQQSMQQQRQQLGMRNAGDDEGLFDGQDNQLWAVLGTRTAHNEDLPQHAQDRNGYEPSHVSTTYHGSTTVASLRPAVNLNSIPQIFNNGGNYDWSEKVSAPGTNDMSKFK